MVSTLRKMLLLMLIMMGSASCLLSIDSDSKGIDGALVEDEDGRSSSGVGHQLCVQQHA